jgi:hypothetical protein
VADLVEQALKRLERVGVTLTRGLGDREFVRIEERFGFRFSAEHRAMLAVALPTGRYWVDWRHAAPDDLQGRLDWPVDGVVFDVHNNGFWPASWGERPVGRAMAEQRARSHLARVPTLVPVYSHRYLPAGPAPAPSPVFSVHQTDVIFYGDNLLDYLAHEFGMTPPHPADLNGRRHIDFWSDLAECVDPDDL